GRAAPRRSRGRSPAHPAEYRGPAVAGPPARRRAGQRPSARAARPASGRAGLRPPADRSPPRPRRLAPRDSLLARGLVEDVGPLGHPRFAMALLALEALGAVPPDGPAALLLELEVRALFLEFAQELGDVGFVHDGP